MVKKTVTREVNAVNLFTFYYHKYNKIRKYPLTKGAKRCKVISRSNWNKAATPSPWLYDVHDLPVRSLV